MLYRAKNNMKVTFDEQMTSSDIDYIVGDIVEYAKQTLDAITSEHLVFNETVFVWEQHFRPMVPYKYRKGIVTTDILSRVMCACEDAGYHARTGICGEESEYSEFVHFDTPIQKGNYYMHIFL